VRESGGLALATPEADIPKWMRLAASKEGIALCPEDPRFAWCALDELLRRGVIKPDERILVFNTGAAQKYPEGGARRTRTDRYQKKPMDWNAI